MSWAFIILFIVTLFIFLFVEEYRKGTINRAKEHGILIQGEHYSVFTILRESSYTQGEVYVKHHNVKYFGEIMLLSPEKKRIYISERHLLYCLKVRKHDYKSKIEGKWTYRWSEWKIDLNSYDNNCINSYNNRRRPACRCRPSCCR